jgi:hypothetical protein
MDSTSMGSPPTSEAEASRLRFLDPSGVAIGGPSEWAPALIEVLVPTGAWEDVRILRQGQELPVSLRRIGEQVRVTAEWPRSGTGHYRLRLEWREMVEEQTVTLVPQKISLDAYQRLLDALTSRLPAAVALGLQRLGALAGIKLLPPGESTLAAELVRLRRAVVGTPGRPGLIQVLLALARDPHQMLRAREVWVPERRARRPHPSRLSLALTRGPGGAQAQDRRLILDTQVEHTPDVYENRLRKRVCAPGPAASSTARARPRGRKTGTPPRRSAGALAAVPTGTKAGCLSRRCQFARAFADAAHDGPAETPAVSGGAGGVSGIAPQCGRAARVARAGTHPWNSFRRFTSSGARWRCCLSCWR